ncbi:MAG TPA: hypothetical protein VMA35_12140 [Candidatus Sulfopaludibacter sp.]|nr:hypothetical protein [Candidatus Sulfopaludibacter sp.]
MEEFCSVGKESTRLRRRRAVRSKAFAPIRNKKLIETTAEDFLNHAKSDPASGVTSGALAITEETQSAMASWTNSAAMTLETFMSLAEATLFD